MAGVISLSALAQQIEDVMDERFGGYTYRITAEICDVKKYPGPRRCYLKFMERAEGATLAEMKGVFWSNSYAQVEQFEQATGQVFADGITITCEVAVRFHRRYGLNLDVLGIDIAYALGARELERQHTLERLVRENPDKITCIDGRYRTYNNMLPLPSVVQRVALVTAPDSDGRRDFCKELEHNRYGYAYRVTDFPAGVQGDLAHRQMLEQLLVIAQQRELFDVVVMVRGGGSQTDFRPFEDYNLARCVGRFPVPVLTGIGHDRNTSIVDLMARELKTPTKVAAMITDHNFEFENTVLLLRDRVNDRADRLLKRAGDNLQSLSRLVKLASPEAVLRKGFAMVVHKGRIITDPAAIAVNDEVETILKNERITGTVTRRTPYEPTEL